MAKSSRNTSHKKRTDNTHRLLYYLQERTTSKHADWRNATLRLFYQLYELRRDNPGIFLWVRAVDGVTVHLGTQQIVDFQFAQRHMLINAGLRSPLLSLGDRLFGKAALHEGSGVRQWKIQTIAEIDRLLGVLRRLPKEDVAAASQSRSIPQRVREIVWERDGGKCKQCRSATNIHFDHIIPFAKGGSSTDPKNIRLLCAKHNLEQSASMKF